jgi:hypothetical protein
LRRYDVAARTTQDIFTVNDATGVGANVSPDGQWVVFASIVQGDAQGIQLVRVDGKYHQTLYCTQNQHGLSGMVLSPDQHTLVFNEEGAYDTQNPRSQGDTLYALDMTTGKLHVMLSSSQPGYPGTPAQAASTSSFHAYSDHLQQNERTSGQFMPLPGPTPITIYLPIKWASNSSVYLLGRPIEPGSGVQPHDLYQLLDISKDVSQQSSNLKLLTQQLHQNACLDYDITLDNTQIVCNANPIMGGSSTTAIKIEAIAGGTLKSVYSAPNDTQVLARAISDTTMLFTLDKLESGSQLWKVNMDGTGATQLMATAASSHLLSFALYSYLPGANISRDGSMYALRSYDLTNSVDTLLVGSMNGGTPTTFATSTQGGAFALVGWTSA